MTTNTHIHPATHQSPTDSLEQATPDPSSRPRVDHAVIAAQIAAALGETGEKQLRQIKHLVWALGHQQALFLLHQAQAIMVAGGLLITSEKRPRTIGGIFFWLAFTTGEPRPGRQLRRTEWRSRKPAQEPEALAAS